jgi:arylsulfatase A-like enzyme
VPTIFQLADAAGLRTAAFFSKAKFNHLVTPGSPDYAQAPTFGLAPRGAVRTSEDAAWYIRRARPHLTFVHLAEPDYAGHTIGWMTPAYGANVAIADRALARIVAAADETFGAGGYTLIVTADHGGHGRNHGVSGDDPRDVTIPWIAYGARVRAGTRLDTANVRTTATASTALWLLGVPVPASWPSPPVTAAFRADPTPAAAPPAIPPADTLVTQRTSAATARPAGDPARPRPLAGRAPPDAR